MKLVSPWQGLGQEVGDAVSHDATHVEGGQDPGHEKTVGFKSAHRAMEPQNKKKRKMNKRIVVWEQRHSRLGHAWTRNHKAVTPTPEESRLPSLSPLFLRTSPSVYSV
ncbi:hypothetical protein N7509_010929 [Penicillium cosmopolitanum]|uniref:Uncharacterized protein n=1 Tax=Penicillium cosmopolitanum TaxID=1131564 RepID=A0A9W9VS95_9EURO|nr:uncharacterized protein N7509_010929 [Penicillium cosmopolitanum]KAJ5388388.1 hypothetical protein N7509_010929 [Penicillium cosmopolitanum]